MGLFSSSKKNRQGRTAQERDAQDSGHFYSKDDDAAIGERARAKRASNAGGGSTRRQPNDPLLPEKKRARRRLVGAIALALAVAVGLPMLLDSEPKPLAGDIAIQIPAKDKAAPLPVPGDKVVAAKDSVDKDEEVVAAPPAAAGAEPAKVEAPKVEPVKIDTPKAEPAKPEPAKPEHKPEPVKVEHKEVKKVETHAEDKAAKTDKAEKADKPVKSKAEDKPAKPHDDSARALAILEDKDKPLEKEKPAPSSQKYVLQVAAMSSTEKAAEVQAKLREAGISSYTQKTTTASGELIRVRVGPLSHDDAEKVNAKLAKLGMSAKMSPL